MTKISTGAITTHVQRLDAVRPPEEMGEAPVVVFVHGLLTDSLASYYFTLGPAFAAAGIDVIMYDLRGHGRSDRPASGYRVENFVDDLVGLLDALGEKRPVHVVGNSFGGTVAAGLSAWHPERVATVTLIESEPPVPVWTEHISVGLASAKRQLVRDEAIDWIRDNHGAHTARLSRGASRILESTTLAEEVAAGRTIDADLSALTRPMLAIFGDESGLSDQKSYLEANVPAEIRVVVLPEQGHSVLVERTEETRDLVLDWVLRHTLAEAVR
ncbi:alpha/beta hydrolase [Streptomyces sp. SL13]|jgi:pimeloyl-ACP methyl ester carboxylesterase|uniref:Alpha/beta hydrolase n=1 Tax=Streptantibioticus silvisoli TaxID=2705255 RepID=A0AA90KGQ6_9ACTN|nr:alpha/beta hydrolase [Streptantibioticus silvisoli]MDI5964637.1 alpha/beta hydrolase [Streptantibioticus silvisoli]MDI5970860.1 alpha/beta hydrolase [Streptantibioticus silvisoli]